MGQKDEHQPLILDLLQHSANIPLKDKCAAKALFGLACEHANELGMTHMALTLYMPSDGASPATAFYSNYPPGWHEHCASAEFAVDNPVANACRHNTLPVLWDDVQFGSRQQLRDDAAAFGITHGWSQSVHDAQGNESQLSISRPHRPVDSREMYNSAGQMMYLCHLLHRSLSRFHLAQVQRTAAQVQRTAAQVQRTAAQDHELTRCELEVLHWTSQGKTAAVIALILKRSISTVNFHMSSVRAKLGACNKAQAIAIAKERRLL